MHEPSCQMTIIYDIKQIEFFLFINIYHNQHIIMREKQSYNIQCKCSGIRLIYCSYS